MKTVIVRIIVAVVLVLSSISICLSNDNGCDDGPSYSQSQGPDTQSSSQGQNEDHHCICSFSCNNLFVECSTAETKNTALVISSTQFQYIQITYPQVLISLDKPPAA